MTRPPAPRTTRGRGGAKRHRAAGGKLDGAWWPGGHPRQRRHRLALGAGGVRHHPLRRHQLGGADVDHVGVGHPQESEFAGDAHVAHHRPANERHPPAQCHCGIDDLLNPVHVGGEAGHDDAALGAADQPVQGRADFAFRGADAGQLGVGRIAQEQIDPGVTEPRHAGQIGGPAVQGKLVELDVAGVQNRSGAGVYGDRQRVGDGVVDGEVFAFEHAVGALAPLGHLDEHRLEPVFAALGGDQGQGEFRTDDRDVGPQLEQVGNAADVVLVRVGEHQRLDVVEPVFDVPQVRQDQIDAGLVVGGKHHPAVDDQQPAQVLENRHVAADFADAAQRGDPQPPGGQRARRGEVYIHCSDAPRVT